jgi:hypothetical protein
MSPWSLINGATTAANTTTAPDGTLTADTLTFNGTAFGQIQQASTRTTGDVLTFSLWIKSSTFTSIDLYIGSSPSSVAITSSWQRVSITKTLGANDATPKIVSSAAGSVDIWGAQLVQGTSALDYQATETRLNIPRLDYSLGSCPNILLEPQRTNLNTFSEEFNNATFWLRGTGVSVNANTSNSPSGTLTADTITGATGPFVWTGAGTFFRSYTTLSVSTAYTFSAYLKGTGSVTMTWRDGTTGGNNSVVCNLTSSWQRFEITRTTGAATSNMAIIFHSASGNFDAWGGQMELGAYATSYIPTTSASVTRNADVISRGNIFTNGLITASGGTWFVDFRNNVPIQSQAGGDFFMLSEFGNFTGAFLRFATDAAFASRLRLIKRTGGVSSNIWDSTTTNLKVAIKWNGSTADVFANGVKVISATAFTETALNFINNGGQATKVFNSMALFPTPLTDGEMSMLTSGVYTPALAYAQLGLVSESPACLTSSVNALL